MTAIDGELLKKLSPTYQHKYGVNYGDIEKALLLQKMIECRKEIPTPGDIVVCKGPKAIYSAGHLAKLPTMFSSICVEPYVPFVSIDYKNDCFENELMFSTSGGYWLSLKESEELKFIDKKEKMFKAWGYCGPCGDGAFYFPAVVNRWELFSEDIY